MSELKPCPFCGDLDPYVSGDDWNGWYVVCSGCGADGSTESTKAEAIDAWNTRAERTCRMEYNEDWSGDELYPTEAYQCSMCGGITQEGRPHYCPNCGAKVVE